MSINELIKIGSTIKELRIAKGYDQKQISGLLEINRSTYSNYENNHREPDLKTLTKIARVLEFPIIKFIQPNLDFIEVKLSFERESRNISIDDFALLLDISKDELLDYECGVKDVSAIIIIKVAILLGVTLVSLSDADYTKYFDFKCFTIDKVYIFLNTVFQDHKSLELLSGAVSDDDYNNLSNFIDKREQLQFTKNNQFFDHTCSDLKAIYEAITSIDKPDESIIERIIHDKELGAYLEYLYYKYSSSKNIKI